MEQPQRILVRAPNWLGDHVMALSCYREIRRLFPKGHLVCWHPSGLKGVLPPDIFDEEWSFEKSDLKDRRKKKEWIEKISKSKFDLSINLTAGWSGALLFFRSGIPRRVGFSESGSGILSTSSKPFQGVKAGLHKSQLYLDLLSLLGGSLSELAREVDTSSQNSEKENFWILAPGAALPLREWPYFPELIFEIKKKYPEKVLKIVGTSLESAWKSRIERWNLPGVEDWIGKTSLLELKQLCSKAQLVLANDSGVAHLAATLGRARTLVLFGPGNPAYIAPQGPTVVPIQAEHLVPCSPCEKPYCRAPYGYQKCLKDISIETVLRKIDSALSL